MSYSKVCESGRMISSWVSLQSRSGNSCARVLIPSRPVTRRRSSGSIQNKRYSYSKVSNEKVTLSDILLCRTLSNVGSGRSKGAHLQTRYSSRFRHAGRTRSATPFIGRGIRGAYGRTRIAHRFFRVLPRNPRIPRPFFLRAFC